MLVLTRKSNEKIRIGDDIVITVLRTKGKAVRLGIEAPNELRVLRGEIAFEGEEADATPSESSDQEVPHKTVHGRVSRSDIGRILPQLASDGGPLAGFVSNANVVAQ